MQHSIQPDPPAGTQTKQASEFASSSIMYSSVMFVPGPPVMYGYWIHNAAGTGHVAPTSSNDQKDEHREAPPLTMSKRPETIAQQVGIGRDDQREYITHTGHRLPSNVAMLPFYHYGVPAPVMYRICRVCLRPRSVRYHKEHPFFSQGYSALPGVCSRCKITPADQESNAVEIENVKESRDVKLGVRCLVPDEGCVTQEQLGQKRGPKYPVTVEHKYRESSRDPAIAPPRHITYTMVPPSPNYLPQGSFSNTQGKQKHCMTTMGTKGTSEANSSRKQSRISTEANLSDNSKTICHNSSSGGGVRDRILYTETERDEVVPDMATISIDNALRAEARKLVEQEVRRYLGDQAYKHMAAHIESDLRKVAREEIERYRGAERKLAAHKDAYAHGKLVPLERRAAATDRGPTNIESRLISHLPDVVIENERDSDSLSSEMIEHIIHSRLSDQKSSNNTVREAEAKCLHGALRRSENSTTSTSRRDIKLGNSSYRPVLIEQGVSQAQKLRGSYRRGKMWISSEDESDDSPSILTKTRLKARQPLGARNMPTGMSGPPFTSVTTDTSQSAGKRNRLANAMCDSPSRENLRSAAVVRETWQSPARRQRREHETRRVDMTRGRDKAGHSGERPGPPYASSPDRKHSLSTVSWRGSDAPSYVSSDESLQ